MYVYVYYAYCIYLFVGFLIIFKKKEVIISSALYEYLNFYIYMYIFFVVVNNICVCTLCHQGCMHAVS